MGDYIFSVVIPAHNEEKYIGKCLESVAKATKHIEPDTAEIIVVCNRIDRVQHAGDADVIFLFTIADIAVAVIIIHRQAENHSVPTNVFLGKFFIFQKRCHRICGML